ncbi:MAG: hypothetical protein ACI4WH_05865 [Oscillospiraceae bacterium]
MKDTIKVKRGKFNLEFDTDKITNQDTFNNPSTNTVTENVKVEIIEPENSKYDHQFLMLKIIISFILGFIMCILLYSLIYDQDFIIKVLKIFK